jgi:hypothetical protein
VVLDAWACRHAHSTSHPRGQPGGGHEDSFSRGTPEYCARDLIVAFAAEVDGARVQCAITAEALEDHFGAASLREDDLIAAFNSNRHPIEHAARRLLHEIGAKPVLMHSGYFRFCE